MVSTDNSYFLSDVHTDCQFQTLTGPNRAVTRFKLYFPSSTHVSDRQSPNPKLLTTEKYKDEPQSSVHDTSLEASIENVAENKTRGTTHITEYGTKSEIHTESDDKHETKIQFDEDGDLIVHRNSHRSHNSGKDKYPYSDDDFEEGKLCNRNDDSEVDSNLLPVRKKIKLDLPNIVSTVSNEVRQDKVDVFSDNFGRIQELEKITEDIGEYIDSRNLCNTLSKDVTDMCKCCGNCAVTDHQFDCKSQQKKLCDGCAQKKLCDGCAQKKHPDKGKQKVVRKSKGNKGISGITLQSSVYSGGTTDTSHEHIGKPGTKDVFLGGYGNKGTSATRRDLETKFDSYYLSIKHSLATDLEAVGEQVWHGALILSDYIISYHGDFENKTIVDLGAGVGLSSIVAAMYGKTVFCTDTGETVLSLAEDNVYNATICPTLPRPLCPVLVKQLDWFTGLEVEECKHGLTEADITSIYNCDILIAADVIYDFDMTDAFFNVVQQIMIRPPAKTLYIGLEKRLVFTVEDLAVTSPGYNYFRLHLDDLCTSEGTDTLVCFEAEQIDTRLQQYFSYNRIKQLEVWKITTILQKS